MSAPFGQFALTMGDITRLIRDTFETFIDPRTGKNKSYTLVDAGPVSYTHLTLPTILRV